MPVQPAGKDTEEMEAEGDSAAEMNGEEEESEEERSGSQTESEEESSEMDDEDYERRRGECVNEMLDLEKQFSELKEKLFRERLSQLRVRLEEVGAERAPEYTEPLGGLQRSLKIRIQVAGIYKGFCLDVIRNKYECELQGAKQHLEVNGAGSLHRSVLKPLRPILAARLRRRLSADGSLGRLAEGLRLARSQGPGAFGFHLSLPSPGEMEQVRQKLLQLLRAYSPSAQVKRLLQACKLLYTALRTQAGEGAGADAFLPLLSLVLAQCDLPELLLEAEYMSELLEPTLLTGEGGYYLTSLSASLALLSGLDQAHMLPLSPSQELQRSLSLWEQRRLPATHSFQHLLRVAYQDPSSGCTSKTLAVPPGASVATLNQLCATKFRVTQPDTFGLFLYREQGYHRLSPGALVHRLPTTGYLVYRKAERPDTHGAAPGATTERDSGELEAGGREEEEGGRGDGIIEVKAGPGDSRGESETTGERVQGSVGQAGGGPAPPGGPEAEGSRAAEE
uniref:ras and Rab interactor 1-like n=1 Tax=Panthera onca TaxID=9690 RepID=UPI002953FF70|nr:ras and Rab interactor 1-like [Panthera onca]